MKSFPEFSTIRLKIALQDDEGRTVPAGTKGTIVGVSSEAETGEPLYVVETGLADSRGCKEHAGLVEARHHEVRLAG